MNIFFLLLLCESLCIPNAICQDFQEEVTTTVNLPKPLKYDRTLKHGLLSETLIRISAVGRGRVSPRSSNRFFCRGMCDFSKEEKAYGTLAN